MSPESKKWLQIVLVLAIAIAAVRAGYIVYERRHESAEPAKAQAPRVDPDYYVVPKKLHAHDLKSAKELTQQPVWVREGYRFTYYPYAAASHRADFSHEAGLLLPIERLEIKDVVTNPAPGGGGKQVLAVFEKDGKEFAVPVGTASGDDYTIYSDEMFFIQDPHDLYTWPADVWDLVGKHEVREGMNEFQAGFALGMGVPQAGGDSMNKMVNYPNGGNPMTITFRAGKATEITRGK